MKWGIVNWKGYYLRKYITFKLIYIENIISISNLAIIYNKLALVGWVDLQMRMIVLNNQRKLFITLPMLLIGESSSSAEVVEELKMIIWWLSVMFPVLEKTGHGLKSREC